MPVVRGTVLQFGRFGAVVRLDDGRLAVLPADEPGIADVRRASTGGVKPHVEFIVADERDGRVRLSLADARDEREVPARAMRPSSSFEQKIIDYLRESAERDPRAAAAAERVEERARPDRLLPFELRARRQYRESPKRPRRPKR